MKKAVSMILLFSSESVSLPVCLCGNGGMLFYAANDQPHGQEMLCVILMIGKGRAGMTVLMV